MLGIVGCILGFAVLVYLCYKDVSVFVVSIIASFVVIIFNGLDITDAMVKTYFSGAGTYFGTYIGLYIFGAILGKIYSYSGAAASISKTIMRLLIKPEDSDKKKQRLSLMVVILSGALLCYGGINCVILIFTIYPLALVIFEQAGIPRKYIVGAILGGTVTFAMTGPGSPQPPNVVAMNILGTASTAGLIPGIVASIVELIIMVVVLDKFITSGKAKGEHFSYGENDIVLDETKKLPGFIVSLLPLAAVFIFFNIIKLNLVFALMIGCVLSLILFGKNIGAFREIMAAVNEGAAMAPASMFSVAAVVGFGMVVQSTEGFSILVESLLSLKMNPYLLIALSVAILAALTGGAAAAQQLALPMIAPTIIETMGVPAKVIHRISCFAGSAWDTIPSSGSVIMCVNATGLKLKEAYPSIFVTTVLATSCGTAVVAIMLALFPGLA